jgi:uncharacterized protein (DUF342 family)
MILFENNMFRLYQEVNEIFIQLKAQGATLGDVNKALKDYPRVGIQSFAELQNILNNTTVEKTKIGELKDRVEIELSKDEMAAYLRVNVTKTEADRDEQAIKNEIVDKINELGICVGVDGNILKGEFALNRKQTLAQGIQPIAGKDCKYKYFQLSDGKPELKEDGKADLYEMNLIDNVNVGDWLGEKTKPLPGIPGQTVLGRELPAKAGRDYHMKFDAKSVLELEEGDKFVLRAKKEGAVKFESGRIMVHNHLIIAGDVDYETGNIRFDGDVTIKGTIKDKFIVEATGDISIESPNGIGAVEKIVSKKGNIYIKGGINGRGDAVIVARDSIFVKYVNESHLIAHNQINIGLYAIESILKADKVVMDPIKGRLIGGEVQAEHKIVAGSIGNKQERQTKIRVMGFERQQIKERLEDLQVSFKEVILETNRLKRQLEIFENNMEQLDERAVNSYRNMINQYEEQIDEINRLNGEVVILEDTLRTRGDGEVKIHQAVYPKTYLEIKSLQKRVKELMSCSFYVQDRRLHSV